MVPFFCGSGLVVCRVCCTLGCATRGRPGPVDVARVDDIIPEIPAFGIHSHSHTHSLTHNTTLARQDNSADNGGAISSQHGDLIVNSTTLRSNSGTTNGGAVYASDGPVTLLNSTFASNSASGGGGFSAYPSTMSAEVAGCWFESNYASSFGAALQFPGASFATITGTVFVGHTVSLCGVVDAGNNAVIQWADSAATSNSATSILSFSGAAANIRSSVFTGNTVSLACLMGQTFELTLSGSSFTANSGYSGAVYALDSFAEVSACAFTDNSSPARGGALSLAGATYISVDDSNFTVSL